MKKCEFCNEEIKFTTKQNYAKAKYCSINCRMKALAIKKTKEKTKIICIICGKEKYVKSCISHRYKTCGSEECKKIFRMKNVPASFNYRGVSVSEETRKKISIGKIGEKNPNWKNGSGAYHRIAKEKFEKKCFACGSIKHVEIHHLDGDHRNNNDISNLCFLCKSCHTKIHQKERNFDGKDKKN